MSDLDLECDLLSPPNVVYSSWLDSWIHGAITEALAAINPTPEGQYRLWSGSVHGRFLDLVPNKKIKMTWRTVEFSLSDQDTVVTINLIPYKHGTRFHVFHEQIPDVFLEQFRFAWEDYYFPRMRNFFVQQ